MANYLRVEMTLWRDVKACILKGNAVSFPKITCQICLYSEITITGLHPPDLIASIPADERKTLAVLPCGHKIKPFFVHGTMEVGRGSRSNEQKIDMVARHLIPLTTTEHRTSAFVHPSGRAGVAHQLTCEHCFRENSTITCKEEPSLPLPSSRPTALAQRAIRVGMLSMTVRRS